MIHDLLANIALYRPVHARFAAAIDWLTATDLKSLTPDGQHKPILGDDVFAIVSSYTTLLPEAYIWESHRKYIDIQLLVSGQEQIGITPLSDALTITTPYDAAKDAQFYARDTRPAATLHMTSGSFAVFFPHDVHGPNQAWGGQAAAVTKVVVKVAA